MDEFFWVGYMGWNDCGGDGGACGTGYEYLGRGGVMWLGQGWRGRLRMGRGKDVLAGNFLGKFLMLRLLLFLDL